VAAAVLLIGFFSARMVLHGPQSTTNVAVGPARDSSLAAPQHPTPEAPAQPGNAASQAKAAPVEIAQLADLHLPSYHAPVLRGETQDSAFESGMKQYAAGNCAGAMNTLSQVDPNSASRAAAQFYSGVCRMHTGDFAGAAAALRPVATAAESPYQESALYYLAQIALAQSKGAEARHDLKQVVALRGDLEHQARRQLAQIPPEN
jgi:TolA-binding protein